MQLLAIAAGFAVAGLIGLVNGYVIAYLGVSPILATLGTMTLCKGIAIGLTRGNVISGFPDPIIFIGNGTISGVPFALVVFALCAVPVAILLNATPFGAKVYMIGSNEKATRYSGVDTRAVLLRTLCVLQPACRRRGGGDVGAVQFRQRSIWRELSPGHHSRGRARRHRSVRWLRQGRRAILALVILQMISSAFNLLNLSQFLTLAIWGGILIAVAAVPHFAGKAPR